MSFVDRYWEWRRRRALKTSLHSQERASELELVAKVIMEHRAAISPSPEDQAPSTDRFPAVSEWSGPALSRLDRKAPQKFLYRSESSGDDTPSHPTEGQERPGAHGSGYPAILVAVDGTSSATEAGAHAVRLAQNLRAKLFVLGFINVRMASRMGIYRFRALTELERESWEAMRRTEKMAQESGVECAVRWVLDPYPSRAIVAAAQEVGADCVVIGSPGVSALEHILDRVLGGVYEKVLRRAECPVLSVRY